MKKILSVISIMLVLALVCAGAIIVIATCYDNYKTSGESLKIESEEKTFLVINVGHYYNLTINNQSNMVQLNGVDVDFATEIDPRDITYYGNNSMGIQIVKEGEKINFAFTLISDETSFLPIWYEAQDFAYKAVGR